MIHPSFLLIMLQVCKVAAVPASPIRVVINGATIAIEIPDGIDAVDSILPKCREHDLLPEDCNRLIDHAISISTHHPDNGGKSTPIAPSDNSDELTVNPAEIETVKDPSGAVDYSHREGPVLDIVLPGGVKTSLQCYIGEQPENAIRRFCTKHRLSGPDCTTLRSHFFKLRGIDVGVQQESSLAGPSLVVKKYSASWSQMSQVGSIILIVGAYLIQWRDDEVAQRNAGNRQPAE